MASCQTWSSATSHIRHPWFDTTVMKRKHEVVSPDEEQDLASPAPVDPAHRAHLPKRRRFSTLENGFAQMSLEVPNTEPVPYGDLADEDMCGVGPSSSSSAYPSAIDLLYQTPYTVEEPLAPEVKMKSSSWYEPEPDRIVITDMDSFTEEDEEQDGNVSINPVLLDAIRSNTIENSTTTKTPAESTSQALVLFRPLPTGSDMKKKDEEQRTRGAVETRVVDEDAMDVED
ncbi:hypothetical protein CPB84DRAFT_1748430 [Gymnopilus junonius]|uniref:Uncharacterized protein n=1 Tax=Gymnopilus junonius TaxID=109634 RepID=A0A9P5NL33_GYMJU|nr:hypothetical protein CPB84DRAFT_1748430 [Gymnopilus junonius]